MTTAKETITYAIRETSAGRLIVGMSASGVVWASLRDTDEELLSELVRRFPRAQVQIAGTEHAGWIDGVVAHVEDPHGAGAVPLDMRGTEFQKAVWAELLTIPPGETRSYSQVAGAIGRPTAVRAVAQACGANPVAVVVPCHRVIGADGSLTGYAGGLDRKRALLEGEKRR